MKTLILLLAVASLTLGCADELQNSEQLLREASARISELERQLEDERDQFAEAYGDLLEKYEARQKQSAQEIALLNARLRETKLQMQDLVESTEALKNYVDLLQQRLDLIGEGEALQPGDE